MRKMNETGLFLTLKEKVRIGHTAVVVVDVQNDFCADGGWYAKNNNLDMIQSMVPRLNSFLRKTRSKGVLTVLIKTIYNKHVISAVMREKLIQRGLDLEYCLENTWGSEFYMIEPTPADVIIVKQRHSGFFQTELDTVLRHHGIKTVILTGVATNVCVESTAREAFAMDYYVVLLSDCTGTFSSQLQELTLLNIDKVFGSVCSSERIMTIWEPF
jgi:ureidoacrylate peracid hydrolase